MALVSDFDGVILDYGGVLARHQSSDDVARMASMAQLSPDHFTERYWSERPSYDQGLISNIEYWNAVVGTTLNEEKIVALTDADIESWMHYDEPVWSWVAELQRAGRKVGMLSNMPLDLGLALKTASDKLDRFDHVTLSYEVHSVKPEPQIYEECLEGLGTTANRTLFLDDRLENVQGAELIGMRALLFTDSSEMLLRLRE